MLTSAIKTKLTQGGYTETFARLYCADVGGVQAQVKRYLEAAGEFEALFGAEREVSLFSAPGRTEIGGNHTDHQRGRVLAAAVNLDVIGLASKNNDNVIRIKSAGYEQDNVSLDSLQPVGEEKNRAIALIRGIAARFAELGYKIGGFDAYTTTNVLQGSGLSSSAAFEVLVGTMLSHLYNDGRVTPVEVAQIGQYSENKYFGKPCGLMDQTASAVGGFVAIDFCDPANPKVEKLDFDFAASGYALCIINTGGNHADLTPDYAAIPAEMKAVAAYFGKGALREVDKEEFFAALGDLRQRVGDRAILRAMHFFADDNRVPQQASALRQNNFDAFKRLILESGKSSFEYLQNVYSPRSPQEQGVSLALAVSERVLAGRGAWRVHGGGFAGTTQAFVPLDLLEDFRRQIEQVMGKGACHVLSVRPDGGVRVI